MSDEPLDLQETEGDEPFEFPPPERKIGTQPYDLSLQTLVEQWDTNLLLVPDIQREYVWDNGRASRLIESLILNIPVPPLYFAETREAQFEVIDGHQRVRSMVRYLKNEFALSGLRVLSEYKGLRFHKLPSREQRFLKTRTLRVVVINSDSHPNMKFEVFERLNTGGITLNAQELRNSLYRGSFNKRLKMLVREAHFRECMGTKKPRKRMLDEELVLRFFAMHERLAEYKPPLKRFLNTYNDDNKNAKDEWLDEKATLFIETMRRVNSVLGKNAFRLIDEHGNPFKDEKGKALPRGVNRALFDAQALAFSWATTDFPLENNAPLLASIANSLRDERVRDALRQATGDRARIFLRVRSMVEALNNADVVAEAPVQLDD